MSAKTYDDKAKCPKGHRFTVLRQVGTVGKTVRSYCQMCGRACQLKAGPVPATQTNEGAGK